MARKSTDTKKAGDRGVVRALAFSAIACITGAVAIVGMHALIRDYRIALEDARQPEDTVMVMVAARDLYQGIRITEADLYAVEMPPRYLPEDVYLNPDFVVGRVPRERILANELVRSDRLADPESGRGMNAVIPRGLRAISVDLGDGRALDGFLQPGNHVDLLVTIRPEDEGEVTTRTILESLFVLGVNSRMEDEDDEVSEKRGRQRPSVTLLVTGDQAESVAFASAMGDLTLSLRSNDDLDPNGEIGEGVTLAQLRRTVQTVHQPVRVRAQPEYGDFTIYLGPNGNRYKVDAEGNIVD